MKKILYVDDKIENLNAAKSFFSSLDDHVIECYQDIEKAKQAIDNSIKNKDIYYLCLFDLEMPDKNGEMKELGKEIYKYALTNGLFSVICTQRDPMGNHGPATILKYFSGESSFNGKKSDEETWKKIWTKIKKDNLIEDIYNSLKRYSKYVGKSCDLSYLSEVKK